MYTLQSYIKILKLNSLNEKLFTYNKHLFTDAAVIPISIDRAIKMKFRISKSKSKFELLETNFYILR